MKENKVPITRIGRFFGSEDYNLEIEMGSEWLSGDMNFTLVVYQVDKTKTKKRLLLNGQEIKTINFTGKQLTIDKGNMEAGIYCVQFTDKNFNIVNKKIIIQ